LFSAGIPSSLPPNPRISAKIRLSFFSGGEAEIDHDSGAAAICGCAGTAGCTCSIPKQFPERFLAPAGTTTFKRHFDWQPCYQPPSPGDLDEIPLPHRHH
jgi:hypothetical protein